ncbi:MAG: endonuclease/exonuclease/phosphatase family protein [Hyphomicrobiales bacterium]
MPLTDRVEPLLHCISWNIHRCRGNDDIVDPVRTLSVLRDEVWRPGCDALIFQEADEEVPPHDGLLDLHQIEQATGLRCVHDTPDHRWGEGSHGFLGVIIFLHPFFEVDDIVLLDLPGHCHRGAVIVDATRDGQSFRLIGTHLSLWQGLRIAQMRTIGQHLFRRHPRPTALVGDLNEWRPWGGLALSPKVLGAHFAGPAPATFPIRRPFLPLDRVLVSAPGRVASTEVLDGPGIRMASDHRPLAARIAWGG